MLSEYKNAQEDVVTFDKIMIKNQILFTLLLLFSYLNF